MIDFSQLSEPIPRNTEPRWFRGLTKGQRDYVTKLREAFQAGKIHSSRSMGSLLNFAEEELGVRLCCRNPWVTFLQTKPPEASRGKAKKPRR